VVPAPSAVVDGFDLVFAARTGDVVLFDDPGIPATACAASCVSDMTPPRSGKPPATTRADGPAVVSGGGELGHSSRR
jgi:hypothetical protein